MLSALADNHSAARFIIQEQTKEPVSILSLLLKIIRNEGHQYSYSLVYNASVTLNDIVSEVANNYDDLKADFLAYCTSTNLTTVVAVHCICRFYNTNERQPDRPEIDDKLRCDMVTNGIDMIRLLLNKIDTTGRFLIELLKASVHISLCKYITNFMQSTPTDNVEQVLLEKILCLVADMMRDPKNRINQYVTNFHSKDTTRSRQDWYREVVEKTMRFLIVRMFGATSPFLSNTRDYFKLVVKILRGLVHFLLLVIEKYPSYLIRTEEAPKVYSAFMIIHKKLEGKIKDDLRADLEQVIEAVRPADEQEQ